MLEARPCHLREIMKGTWRGGEEQGGASVRVFSRCFGINVMRAGYEHILHSRSWASLSRGKTS